MYDPAFDEEEETASILRKARLKQKRRGGDQNWPTERSGHRMVTTGGRLFVFGGFTELKNGSVKYLNDF